MTDKPENNALDQELEAFFAAEAAVDMTPPDALIATVLRDAQRAQPTPTSVAAHPRNPTWFGDIFRAFGGWQGGLALATCLIIGLSLGYTPPDALRDFASDMLETAGISTGSGGYSPLEDMLAEG
jgi:hypothetical protein